MVKKIAIGFSVGHWKNRLGIFLEELLNTVGFDFAAIEIETIDQLKDEELKHEIEKWDPFIKHFHLWGEVERQYINEKKLPFPSEEKEIIIHSKNLEGISTFKLPPNTVVENSREDNFSRILSVIEPETKICLDISHAMASGYSLNDLLKIPDLIPRVSLIHVSDFLGKKTHLPLGKGSMNLEEFKNFLEETNVSHITLEVQGKARKILSSFKILKKILKT